MVTTQIFSSISPLTLNIIIGAIAFVAGGFLSYLFWQKALKKKRDEIIEDAKGEGEVIKKDKILQAKEKFLQLKAEHEKEINERSNKVISAENKLKQKENSLSQKMEETGRKRKELDAIRENLQVQMDVVEKKN